ncbi:N-6 DNA methylase [Methylobacterium sp. E-045]|uniref:N-6 DNA methylase n=1 Tax=Methylobacterium sp. E-045 TaxID=2836575 RepID=UPI001FBB5026|nr:N-6 DNA methylase [Methylobacterium sp. E-045]MCJ2130911.1 N-6 DNA methylase [Methylobacterium sp. E-045]
MPIDDDALTTIIAELSIRPGHEKVRALLYRLLIEALGAKSERIFFERKIPEVRGRLDALLGRTIIEIKSDLRREARDAEAQLTRYLPEREGATGQRYVGLATDGATFTAYEMRDGALVRLTEHEVKLADARGLTAWLEGVVAVLDWLPADAVGITNELGRQSAAFARTLGLLAKAWEALAADPEAVLKRQLWSRHLGFVYGKAIDDDTLWLQHTYLVILAKAIAAGTMGATGRSPEDLLSGRAFHEAGVHGAVETDFFGWVIQAPGGEAIVAGLSAHAARFDLGSVDVDLLKVLYESLIDPAQRHDLGEYYTPDWLARKVVRRAVDRPAEQTCLDPACGSGSFLFHAVRLKREALTAAGVPLDEIASRCCASVTGLDVHPVAVIFARVTYLLALGDALPGRGGDISLPVYLGDALQWNVKRDAFESDLVVEVPRDPREGRRGAPTLRFPLGLCADPPLFDRVVTAMHDASEAGRTAEVFARGLAGLGVPADQHPTLITTFTIYDRLRRAGRDHVWGFFARNLSRPVALSDGARVDVVIGNPPWLSYRYMAPALQGLFRDTARRLGIWVGPDEARLVTQTDLSGLFFARAAELYVRPPEGGRPGGRVAMVLPLAAMSRGQFRAFRTGDWTGVRVAFSEAWMLDNQAVSPLFRVPTCVLFADVTAGEARPTPRRVTTFAGFLGRKDVPEEVADRCLRQEQADAPIPANFEAVSPYCGVFRNGATLYPRILCLVTRVRGSKIGVSPSSPIVCSEERERKGEWKNVTGLRGAIESSFLRPVYLGESIAPFRVLAPAEGIVPAAAGGTVLSSVQAAGHFPGLAKWLAEAERLWAEFGSEKVSLKQQVDHYGKLSSQIPVAHQRVVFAKAGKWPAACIVRDRRGIIDHKLYWADVPSDDEARFLVAILNSEAVRSRIAHLQSRGEQGARDFDKLMFTLPIPRFDPREAVHARLAAEGAVAEAVAASVTLPAEAAFQKARALVREALREEGVSSRIDALVETLLGPDPRLALPDDAARPVAEEAETVDA